MLDKETLRKADVITGIIIFLFGLFIISQALKMPMKDSWGGVQNVWYVSPALFPLFVGSMIGLLGLILFIRSLTDVGPGALKELCLGLFSTQGRTFLTGDSAFRFYLIVILFTSFVFLFISRVDFILNSIFFLVVFISAFYFDDAVLFKKITLFFTIVCLIYLALLKTGLVNILTEKTSYFSDFYILVFTTVYTIFVYFMIRDRADLKTKFKTASTVSVITTFILGVVFKYFLLVPLMHEGLIVEFMDKIRYLEF